MILKKLFFISLTASVLSCTPGDKSSFKLQIKDTVAKVSKNPFTPIDQSPLDMAYFPTDYPLLKMENGEIKPPVARIIYSRPHKKGRKVFGEDESSLCKYGKPWRLGANEATEIEFFKDVFINNKKITAGRYILYCIPDEKKWTIILNSNIYSWGLHINSKNNIVECECKVLPQTPSIEDFTIKFFPTENGTDLMMCWDTVKVLMNIKLNG